MQVSILGCSARLQTDDGRQASATLRLPCIASHRIDGGSIKTVIDRGCGRSIVLNLNSLIDKPFLAYNHSQSHPQYLRSRHPSSTTMATAAAHAGATLKNVAGKSTVQVRIVLDCVGVGLFESRCLLPAFPAVGYSTSSRTQKRWDGWIDALHLHTHAAVP